MGPVNAGLKCEQSACSTQESNGMKMVAPPNSKGKESPAPPQARPERPVPILPNMATSERHVPCFRAEQCRAPQSSGDRV